MSGEVFSTEFDIEVEASEIEGHTTVFKINDTEVSTVLKYDNKRKLALKLEWNSVYMNADSLSIHVTIMNEDCSRSAECDDKKDTVWLSDDSDVILPLCECDLTEAGGWIVDGKLKMHVVMKGLPFVPKSFDLVTKDNSSPRNDVLYNWDSRSDSQDSWDDSDSDTAYVSFLVRNISEPGLHKVRERVDDGASSEIIMELAVDISEDDNTKFTAAITVSQIAMQCQVNANLTISNSVAKNSRKVELDDVTIAANSVITFDFDVTQKFICDTANGFVRENGSLYLILSMTLAESVNMAYQQLTPTTSTTNTALSTWSDEDEQEEKDDTAVSYVGLVNQGATCYMNAMLQSLYHVPAFRKIVYEMATTGTEDVKKSIPLNLQRLFCKMQLGNKACSTKALTVSFGWDDRETLVQHDTQEFCRVLMDNLEEKMKGSPLEGRIAKLFRGKYRSFIRCKNVPYESSRIEEFYDLSMTVKGSGSLKTAFEKYVEKEELTGDNQYSAEGYGKQDADMGIEFMEFPPVLQLHLRRFEYDYEYDRNVKINEEFKFPQEIDLTDYLASDADRSKSHIYDLYGVLVHSGDVSFGHYYAFLRTSTGAQWYEFNDSRVSKASTSAAINSNFGGYTSRSSYGYGYGYYSYEKSSNAYVLVYVRREDAHEIFEPIPDEFIPKHIRDTVNDVDREEKYHYDDDFDVSCYEIEECLTTNCKNNASGFKCKQLKKKFHYTNGDTYEDVYDKVSKLYEIDSDSFNLWYGQSCPTGYLERSSKKAEKVEWYKTLFIQKLKEGDASEQSRDTALLSMKFFCPKWESPIQFIGTVRINQMRKISELLAMVRQNVGLPEGTPLSIYEETQSKTARLLNVDSEDDTIYRGLYVRDGSLLIFQVDPSAEIPEMTFQPVSSSEKSSDVVGTENVPSEYKDLPVYKYTEFDHCDIATVSAYFAKTMSTDITTVAFMYEDITKPVAVLQFPSSGNPQNGAEEFVVNSLKLDVDLSKDLVLIYKKDYYEDKPAVYPIQEYSYASYNSIFYHTSKKQFVYIRVLKNVTMEQYKKSKILEVVFTNLEGKKVSRNIAVPKSCTYGEITSKVMELDVMQNTKAPLRVYTQKEGAQLLLLTEKTSLYYMHRILIDEIPKDQQEISEDEFIIPVVHAYIDSTDYLEGSGEYWFVKVRKDETFKDLKEKMIKIMELDESKAKMMKFLAGERWVKFSKKNTLNEDDLVFSIPEGNTCYVLTSAKRRGKSSGEEAVRIEN